MPSYIHADIIEARAASIVQALKAAKEATGHESEHVRKFREMLECELSIKRWLRKTPEQKRRIFAARKKRQDEINRLAILSVRNMR
jgi:hypothetical protein